MNNWKINKTVDLAVGVNGVDVWPNALLVENDGNAHEINITVMDDGLPVELTGTATAYFVRVDDATVIEPATVNGNVVSVTLPEACYAYEGDLKAVIRITDGESTVTLGAFLFFVRQITTNFVVDPNEIVPSLEELLQQIQQMENASKAANDAAESANTAADSANKAAEAAQAVMDDIEAALDEAGQALSEAKQTKELSESALNDANQALENANTATSAANDATNLANEAASGANAAADAANQAATDAESRVSAAVQDAETTVDEAIKNAQQQVDESLSAAQQTLDSAVADANSAVEKAVADANTATQAANTAASGADTAAAGANAQANAAEQAAQTASNAAGSAQTATEAAEDATQKALDAAKLAEQAASGVGLRKEVLDHIPEPSEMVENVIYLVPASEPNEDNVYDEYLLIDGKAEPIGSTKVDLTGYVQKDELAAVATSGDYADLTGKPALADVASSGNFADLSGTEDVATNDDVREAVDGIQIGGRNYVRDSSPSRHPTGWTQFHDTTVQLPVNADGYATGSRIGNYVDVITPTPNDVVLEDGQYIISFWAYASDTIKNINIGFVLGEGGTKGIYADTITVSTTPQRIVVPFAISEENRPGKGWRVMISRWNNTPGWNGTLSVKDIKLERGNKATDWTPAPEDTASRFDFKTTIPNIGWSNDVHPKVSVNVPGIIDDDEPIVDVMLTGVAETDDSILEAWGQIIDIETADDAIIVTASEAPTVNIPIHMMEVRNNG